MKRINNLLKSVTVTSLTISFVSFGIAAIGSLIESSVLMLFWYLGLTGLWIMVVAAVVASAVILFDYGLKWVQMHFYPLERHKHHPPHAAT